MEGSKVSIAGTIEKFTVADISESETSYFVAIKENDWFITIDTDLCKQLPANLNKGEKYLLTGNLSLFKPWLAVHKAVDGPSDITPDQVTGKGTNNGEVISISGKIIKLKFLSSRKGTLTANAEFEGVSNMNVFCTGDLAEIFNNAYKEDKVITVMGEFVIQVPQFDIEKYEKI